MKTINRLMMLALALSFIAGCAPKPVNTIENLKAAYNGESTASAKYEAFAVKAESVGLDTIAVMFWATSKAESIHADNHRNVLEKLGVKVTEPLNGTINVQTSEDLADARKVLDKLGVQVAEPLIGTFNVLSTAENLADAINGESYEIESMYPGFNSAAETENVTDAVKSFNWALETEKKHLAFYNSALAALNGAGEKSLPANWYVCPVCGNTYNSSSVPQACDFCMSSSNTFLIF